VKKLLHALGVLAALALPLASPGEKAAHIDVELTTDGHAQLARAGLPPAAESCGGQQELRFEMLSLDEDPFVQPPRRAGVCLAVHRHRD